MEHIFEADKRMEAVKQWRLSDSYRRLNANGVAESERMIAIGTAFYSDLEKLKAEANNRTAKTQYASGGTIHRGIYCPSPVLDLTVGKTSRGRIIKRIVNPARVSHRFGLNAEDALLFCESFANGEQISTEYIIRQGEIQYGITVNRAGELAAVSEEVFAQNGIVKYTYINIYPDGDSYFCASVHIERIVYDDNGLISGEKDSCQPYINAFERYRYCFEREDGFLTSYTAEEYLNDQWIKLPLVYTVRRKQKA